MSDYSEPINIHDYKYRKPVYYTNPLPTYTTNVIVKLALTSDNFNFNLTKEDGSDFRLLYGLGVLKMWIADWSKQRKRSVLFFKIPEIGGGLTVTLTAYWGNTSATSISSPESMGLLFYESFDTSPLSPSKWIGNTNAGVTSYGYLFSMNTSFTSITNPLSNKSSWIMEAGIWPYFGSGTITPSYRCIGFEFVGTENNFHIEFMVQNSLRNNAIEPNQSSTNLIYQDDGGIEDKSYQEIYIEYYEPDDRITTKILNRDNYKDVTYHIWRKVEGDTRLQNIRLWGSQVGQYSGGYPVYVNWLILRDKEDIQPNDLDGRDLYVPYENVPAQAQDYKEYLDDFTNIQYKHESSFGGNPYRLSENGFDADANIWISDNGASLSGVNITVHTGWSEDVTSTEYLHYDSGHVYYYNASKLSNDNNDNMKRNHWECTTTSGWAAIKFLEYKNIGSFRIKTLLSSTIPITYDSTKYNTTSMVHICSSILNGSVTYLSDSNSNTYWQTRYVGISEWVIIDLGVNNAKSMWKVILGGYSGYNNRMPKNFRIEGSTDNYSWDIVFSGITLQTTSSQTFTFIDLTPAYRYWKLYIIDNWGDALLLLGSFELYGGNSKIDVPVAGAPKDFVFYGSNVNPLYHFDNATKLISGTFENTVEWQSRIVPNTGLYKYYILDILNTYGNDKIKIQEWEMMCSIEHSKRKYPAQLRLHPAIYDNLEYNFPKEISLLGSIDSVNWTVLIPWTYTYTPFIQHYEGYGYWQRYSFNNYSGFWSFRLLCKGNWEASDNRVVIGEWSLHELKDEEHTYRILQGSTNNIQQIWATDACGINDEYGIIFASNEKLNKILNDVLVGCVDIPIYYEDFNII